MLILFNVITANYTINTGSYIICSYSVCQVWTVLYF